MNHSVQSARLAPHHSLNPLQWSLLVLSAIFVCFTFAQYLLEGASPPPAQANTDAAWTSARNIVAVAVAAGAALGLALTWMLWRKRASIACNIEARDRISDVVSGLPRPGDVRGWALEQLREQVVTFAEADDYVVSRTIDPRQLLLTRVGRAEPSVMAYCIAGAAGLATGDHVVELVQSLSRRNIATGWLVAPRGLSRKAQKQLLNQRNLVVIDDITFVRMLRGAATCCVKPGLDPQRERARRADYAHAP
jgi:hypothetical protein